MFARLRARLAEELGLDPSAELRALEQQVLRQEVAVPVVSREERTAAPRTPGLPVSSFVGRDADVAEAAELLLGCRVVTLCGPGGVGKTPPRSTPRHPSRGWRPLRSGSAQKQVRPL